jgi:Transposase domain (DUF772)/Transposase DDE domain
MKLLSRIQFGIQRMLLPVLNEEIGPLSDKEKRFVEVCELARIDKVLQNLVWCGNGRKPASRVAIAHAFLAKALWNLPTTRALIDRLKSDTSLRRLCGWHDGPSQVPDEATFSRAFAAFAQMGLCVTAHTDLVTIHLGEEIIHHSSTDSTAIEAREKAHRATPPEVETPPLLADMLLARVVGTASASSTPQAHDRIPQGKAKAKSSEKVKGKRKRGRPRKGEEPPEPEPTRLERHLKGSYEANLLDMPVIQCTHGCKKNAKGHTQHWTGYKLHVSTGDGDIPLAAYMSSASLHDSQPAIILQQAVSQRTKAVFYDLKDAAYDATAIKEHSRTMGSVPIIDANKRRGTEAPPPMEPDRAEHYKARSGAERFNSDLKDNHGGRNVRVRGAAKVMTHLMFGVVVMTAEALLRQL